MSSQLVLDPGNSAEEAGKGVRGGAGAYPSLETGRLPHFTRGSLFPKGDGTLVSPERGPLFPKGDRAMPDVEHRRVSARKRRYMSDGPPVRGRSVR